MNCARNCVVVATAAFAFALTGCNGAGGEGTAATATATAAAMGSAPRGADGLRVQTSEHPIDRATLRALSGDVLVRFRPSASLAARARVLGGARAEVVRAYRAVPGLVRARVRAGQDPRRALAAMSRSTEVLYAEPNHLRRVAAIPNDPLFSEQWGLQNTGQAGGSAGADVRAPEAWELTTGGRDAVVVVVDTGVDMGHPDLAANLWTNPLDCNGDGLDDDGDGFADDCHGVNVLTGTGDPTDDEGHGTHVAGIIGAVGNDGVGVTGVNWTASIAACKWLDADGYGNDADAIACLDWVAALKDRGVNVVATNNSWGGMFTSRALDDAIAAQRARGILFVTASGNDGGDQDEYLMMPCASRQPNVICVGASAPNDWMATFSNEGGHTVHLIAPGEGIVSTYPTSSPYGSHVSLDGTSMATPFVTGAVALYHSLHPGADWRTVKGRILAGAEPVDPWPRRNGTITNRRLDLYGLLACETGAGVTARLRPYDTICTPHQWYAVGATVELAAMNLDCAGPRGEVTVQTSLSGQPAESITLRDDGAGLDVAAEDGVYAAAWVPPGPGTWTLTFPGDDSVEVIVDPHLERGFPAPMWHLDGSYWAGPANSAVVGDIDGEPGLEIVASAHFSGPVYAFHGDGTQVAGWPTLEGWGGVGYASLGKLRDDPGEQVVVNYAGEVIAAYDEAGRLLPGWPPPDYGSSTASWFTGAAPLTQDFDGDGRDEASFTWEINGEGQRWAEHGVGGARAIVDLDGHGDLAVAGGCGYPESATCLWRMDGSIVPGFPVPVVATHPVVGDVDGDGRPELVLNGSPVRVFGIDGTLERTIPLAGTLFWNFADAPALADLDGDGVLDIVVQTSNTLEAFHGDGTPLSGFPHFFGAPGWTSAQDVTAPVIGDVDGDGAPEIVAVVAPSRLYVLDRAGAERPGFPKVLERFGAAYTPALADIDADGRNEIVLVGDDTGEGQRGAVYAFDLGGPPHGAVQWGQFGGNAHHTGNATRVAVAPRTFQRLTVERVGAGSVSSSPWGIACGAVCTRTYVAGTSIALTAAPADGYELAGWTGACTGTAPTCTVLLDADKQTGAEFVLIQRRVTVSKSGSGGGSVRSVPAGIDCGTTCSAIFDGGGLVTLVATPDAHSVLTRWSGGCTDNGGGGCGTYATSDRNVEAVFDRRRYGVYVSTVGGGYSTRVASSPAGLSCDLGDCFGSFEDGTEVTLTPEPEPGFRFVGWDGACSGTAPTCTITVTALVAVTARFEGIPYHRVHATVSGQGGFVTMSPGGLECAASCDPAFAEGTVVTLTATALPGYRLAEWTGDCTGAGETCQVTVDQDRTLGARFEGIPPPQHTLTVTKVGTGTGIVWSAPGHISCGAQCSDVLDEGLVQLTATPDAGSIFAGWSGDCTGTGGCMLDLRADAVVTATFTVRGGDVGAGGGGGGGCATGSGTSIAGLLALVALLRRRRAA